MTRAIPYCYHLTGPYQCLTGNAYAPRPSLDYDRELQTVGVSNLLSGCCGGFTGTI